MKKRSQTSRSPLLSSLMQALQKAFHIEKTGMPANEAPEYYNEKRRNFLINSSKAAAAVGLVAGLEACEKTYETFSGKTIQQKKKSALPSIAIVGGGMAGLHAAYILKNSGYNATVYEASNRTGGRMFSATNIMGQGLTTELGGEFIDSGHLDMLNLAKTFGLELLDTLSASEKTLNQQAFFFNGIHYTEAQVIEAFTPFVRKIKADVRSLSSVIDVDHFTPNDVFFDRLSIADYFNRIGLSGWLRQMLDVAYVTEFGRNIAEQTALNFLFMIDTNLNDNRLDVFGISDERYKIVGGNQQLCDKLAEKLDGQIKTGYKLMAVAESANGSYNLTFDKGHSTTTIPADIVLLTLPFTMLREVEITPALPAWKQNAITAIGYGNNSKLMLGFNSRYWRELGYAGYYFSGNILQSGWDNSQLQSPIAGGLTVYSGGQNAIDVGVGSAAFQANIYLPLLNAMYPGANSDFSGKVERFVWPTHPYTKASYTCFLPGQYTTIAGNEIKPIGNIFFAGEHCSYDYQGYMNGAAETGRLAAKSILKAII